MINHYPEHYFQREGVQDSDFKHIVEDGAKVKNFLKISHLYSEECELKYIR